MELPAGYADTFYDYPLAASFQYFFGDYNNFLPYFGAEYGFHFLEWMIKNPLQKEIEKYSKKGASLKFGILSPFSDNFLLNFNAKYTTIFDRFDYFSLNGGIVYEF